MIYIHIMKKYDGRKFAAAKAELPLTKERQNRPKAQKPIHPDEI